MCTRRMPVLWRTQSGAHGQQSRPRAALHRRRSASSLVVAGWPGRLWMRSQRAAPGCATKAAPRCATKHDIPAPRPSVWRSVPIAVRRDVRRPAPMIAATRLALAQAVRVRGASQPSGARTTAGFGDAGLSATMLHRYRNDQEATLAIAGWTAKCGSPMRRSAVDYPRPRECAPPGPVSGKAV